MRGAFIAAAAAMLLGISAPAVAAPIDFVLCDGYTAPKGKSDGITRGVWLWGLASTTSDFKRNRVSTRESGIMHCDLALADPALVSQFWLRRASLLQSKALHQLAAKQYEPALASLDASDAVGAGKDVLFAESFGLANLAIRALALDLLGRKEEADAALARVNAARPYAMSLHSLSDAISNKFDAERPAFLGRMRNEAILQPQRLSLLFWDSLVFGDFAKALVYGRQIGFEEPHTRSDWMSAEEDQRRYDVIDDRAQIQGAMAYSLAALGDAEGVGRAIAYARAIVAEAVAPPPPPERGKKLSRSVEDDYAARKGAGMQATQTLDAWEKAAKLRLSGDVTMNELLAAVPPESKAAIIAPDLLLRIKGGNAGDTQSATRLAHSLRDHYDEVRKKGLDLTIDRLAAMMPRPEVASMRPRMQTEGGEILRSSLNGYAIRSASTPGLINVRFGSAVASAAMVEEAVLLAAANKVKSLGNDGFVIEATRLIQRTTHVSGMYIGTYDAASGYEVRMLIRPVDSTHLPEALEPLRWRIVSVADVQARLGDKFPTR